MSVSDYYVMKVAANVCVRLLRHYYVVRLLRPITTSDYYVHISDRQRTAKSRHSFFLEISLYRLRAL